MPLAELTLRIGLAALSGLLIGLERQLRGHPAGTRTHLLIAVGASLFTVAGSAGFGEGHGDPTRIAARVSSGIGFLGAGTIIQSGASVRGLTTAATVWVSGALGVSAGAGAYLPLAVGLGAVLLALLRLTALQPLLNCVAPAVTKLRLRYRPGHGTLGPLVHGIADVGQIDGLTIDDDPDLRHVNLRVRVRDRAGLHDLATAIQKRPEVCHLTLH